MYIKIKYFLMSNFYNKKYFVRSISSCPADLLCLGYCQPMDGNTQNNPQRTYAYL
jgi:hypothetical protein